MESLKEIKKKLLGGETYEQKNIYFENQIEHILKFLGERHYQKNNMLESLKKKKLKKLAKNKF